MQFTEGATVVTCGGQNIGSLDRVVIDPKTKEVTSLVVKKGLFFTEDKLIPVELVEQATQDQVMLREDDADLERFPRFRETHYVPADRQPRSEPIPHRPAGSWYWYPPTGGLWPKEGQMYHTRTEEARPAYVKKTVERIPDDVIALEEGAKVLCSDGEHVGDVERVFADPDDKRATHLLISDGLLLKEKKLIPTDWISHISQTQVYLMVASDYVDGLPEYSPEE